MDNPEQAGKEFQRAICERIRQIRLQKGFSLERLAEITGLSKGYLSQIENVEKNPTINTITKIAYGLGEDVVGLITGEKRSPDVPKLAIVRAAERQPIIHPGMPTGYSYEAVAFGKPDRIMDAYIVTFGSEPPVGPHFHEGQEIVFSLEGRHEFHYDDRKFVIEPGDCLIFDSDRAHFSCSLDGKPARVLVIFSNPLRKWASSD